MNQENPQKPEILDYAARIKKESGVSSFRLLGFRLIWVGMFPLCYLTFLSSREFYIYQWVVFSLLTAALSGIGIYENRNLLRKSRVRFILKAILWLFPLLINLLAVQGGYHFNQYIKTRPTRFLIANVNWQIKQDIQAEEALDPSQRRPVSLIIQDSLKKCPNDQWGRPFRCSDQWKNHFNTFGVFSAGPDGIYGNADDISKE